MEVKILAYGQGPLSMVDEQTLIQQLDGEQSIEIRIAPKLMYRKRDIEQGILGLQMYVEYVHEEQKIISYGCVLTLKIEEWKEFMQTERTDDEIRAFVKPAWEKAFVIAEGALLSRIKSDSLQQLILSSLMVNEPLINLIQVECQEDL